MKIVFLLLGTFLSANKLATGQQIQESITATESEPQCFVQGECKHSTLIDESLTLGENSCLHFCQKTQGCKWFTYHPENSFCAALTECSEVSTSDCSNCLSGQTECQDFDNKCLVNGMCQGVLLSEEIASSLEECQDLCLNTRSCGWYSFDPFVPACLLFENCPTLDKSCIACTSSSAKCKAKTSYTKILIAGYGNYDVEIVDLESSASSCSILPQIYSTNLIGAVGALGIQDNPMVCGGGYNATLLYRECFSYENNAWISKFPLTTQRLHAAISAVPFNHDSFKLMITGGYSVSTKSNLATVEFLTETGWRVINPPLPVTIQRHCMVQMDSTSVMVIAGIQNDKIYSRNTFIYNSIHKEWTEGPPLKQGRNFPGCGRIISGIGNSDFNIIVAGGYVFSNDEEVSSVEIWDGTAWRDGPELPVVLREPEMVEDPAGGVIIVGGYRTGFGQLNTLYRLPHSGVGAEWSEMRQKLSRGRSVHVAFLVPDDVANCTMA